MKSEVLSPGVENGEESDVCAEMYGVGGDGLQSGGAGLKQEVVEHFLVVQRQRVESLRDGEDDVKVLHGQQFGSTPLQPLRPCQILTLGAVAVAAGVVTDALMSAVAALFHVPAKACRAALFDGAHQLVLMHGEAMLLAVTRSESAENVSHLDGGAAHSL